LAIARKRLGESGTVTALKVMGNKGAMVDRSVNVRIRNSRTTKRENDMPVPDLRAAEMMKAALVRLLRFIVIGKGRTAYRPRPAT
jgi:hypothetical protein